MLNQSQGTTPSGSLYQALKEGGLDFFVSVPCSLLAGIISLIEDDSEVIYTPVTREEEGIGILAGAALAGKKPAILMQNSGLGNSVNALCSLVLYYRLPLFLVISHRGSAGEEIAAQLPMGRATESILDSINIPYHRADTTNDLGKAGQLLRMGMTEKIPTAVLLPYSFWEGGGDK